MKSFLLFFASLAPVFAVDFVAASYIARDITTWSALALISYLAVVMVICYAYAESKARKELAAQHVWFSVKPAKLRV